MEYTLKISDWTAALRSGKYLQGKSYLIKEISDDETRYCCLGVGCEIAELPRFVSPSIRPHGYAVHHDGTFHAVYNWPFKSQQQLQKFVERNGWPEEKDFCSYLTGLNDNEGRTFEEIADEIKKYTNPDDTIVFEGPQK